MVTLVYFLGLQFPITEHTSCLPMRTNLLWAIAGVLFVQYGNSNPTSSAQTPMCTGPTSNLATPTWLHSTQPCEHREDHPGAFITSFSGSTVCCKNPTQPLPQFCRNGGMEMWTLLESGQWTTYPLPTLWREMGSSSRFDLHSPESTIEVAKTRQRSLCIDM